MFLVSYLGAQTGPGLINIASPLNQVSSKQISPANAYFGSTLQSTVTGDNLSDNFLFEAEVIYQLKANDKWKLPIISRAGIPLAGGSLDNVQLGIYPWTFISSSLIFHAGADFALSLIPGEGSDGTPQDFKILAGLEYVVPTDGLPLTISATPAVNFRNLDRGTDMSLELTAIAPLTTGLGVLIDYELPFKKGAESALNIGIIIVNPLGS